MPDDPSTSGGAPADRTAIGIVVHDSTPPPRRPRSVAFVWAGEEFPLPSLPFGRWKARAA